MTSEGDRSQITNFELPTPYEGELAEIKSEIDQDRKRFFLTAGQRFIAENPYLAALSRYCQKAPDVDLSLDLFTLYYEIFSRAAKTASIFMIFIEKEVVESFTDMEQARLQLTFQGSDEAGFPSHVESRYEENHRRIQEERSKNPEMDKFWYHVDGIEEKLREEGIRTSTEVLMDFYPIYVLQEILLRQDTLNKAVNGLHIPDYLPPQNDI